MLRRAPFDHVPTAPVKKLIFADECEDEVFLEQPEDVMCEPAWSEPLELTGVAEEGQACSTSTQQHSCHTRASNVKVPCVEPGIWASVKEGLGQALVMNVLLVNDSKMSLLHG